MRSASGKNHRLQQPLFNAPELKRAPYLCIRETAAGFERRGQSTARLGRELRFPGRELADGVFGDWSWDGRALVARNDRFGFQPLYYFARQGEIGLSPSLPRLLLEGAPADLDEAGLAVFLRLGFFIGQDTPFRAIRALPPAATLEWRDGELRVSGGFTLVRTQPLGRSEAVDAYVSLFRAAMQRRLPSADEVALPLSGGRDSRHILLELYASGHRPSFCLTVRHFSPRTDQDADIAARLTRALGLPHVVLDQPESRLRAELKKNVQTGFGTDEGTAFMAMGDYLAGRAAIVFDGIGGDVLSAGLFLNAAELALFESGRFAELAEHLCSRWGESRADNLLAEGQRGRFGHELAVRHLSAELERHADAPNPVGSFFFWNRTRREIALFPSCFYGPGVAKLYPYLDHELYNFLASLPAGLFLDRQFHTRAILRAYPQYAHIPFDSYESFYRYDDRHRASIRRLMADLDAYMAEGSPSLICRPDAGARLLQRARAGREFELFSAHLIYLLQLERFVAGLSGSGRRD
jgi:asparagine synthase (glutamine-hydrolysing)